MSDRIERVLLAVEAEAKLQQTALLLGEFTQGFADRASTHRDVRLLARIERSRIGEEASELAVAVFPHRLVERDGGLDGIECLGHMLFLVPGERHELTHSRLVAVNSLELASETSELRPPLVHMCGDANRS